MQKPLSMIIAEFCRRLKFNTLPDEVIQAAKDHLLDALGVGLAASSTGESVGLKAAMRHLGTGGQSTVLGSSAAMPAPSAALLNGAFIHALEFDDTHIPSVMHGSSAVVPTALAMAEKLGCSGEDFLKAIVIGWEVLIPLGLASPGRFQAAGFQTTAVCGPFATASISAALLGLNEKQIANALGIAGSQASGVFEFLSDGSTVKSLHPGWAAHAGIVAAHLAQGGMSGPATILEGEFGLYNTYARDESAGDRLRELVARLGKKYYLPEVSLKAYPCCHYNHSFLECLQKLMGEGLTPEQIESIQCVVPVEEAPIICEPWERKLIPASGYEAKFSLPYCLAALLIDGQVSFQTFDRPDPDPAVINFAQKIFYTSLDNSSFPKCFPGYVEVQLRSGQKLTAAVEDVKGCPRRPLSDAEIQAKFENNAARKLKPEAVSKVALAITQLDKAAALKDLTGALRWVLD
jgi:2-methylcitrate dehydratase PrpD